MEVLLKGGIDAAPAQEMKERKTSTTIKLISDRLIIDGVEEISRFPTQIMIKWARTNWGEIETNKRGLKERITLSYHQLKIRYYHDKANHVVRLKINSKQAQIANQTPRKQEQKPTYVQGPPLQNPTIELWIPRHEIGCATVSDEEKSYQQKISTRQAQWKHLVATRGFKEETDRDSFLAWPPSNPLV